MPRSSGRPVRGLDRPAREADARPHADRVAARVDRDARRLGIAAAATRARSRTPTHPSSDRGRRPGRSGSCRRSAPRRRRHSSRRSRPAARRRDRAGADSARGTLQVPPAGRSTACTVQLDSSACAQTTTTSPFASTATSGITASAPAPTGHAESAISAGAGAAAGAAPGGGDERVAALARTSAFARSALARRHARLQRPAKARSE